SLAQRRSLPRSSCRWPRRGPPRSPLCPTRRSSDLDTARALGMRTDLMRGLVAVLVVLLAGAAVAAAGPIGFVGLAVPHLVRVLTGPDYRWILAFCVVVGPLLLLGADILGRVVARPSEVQVGVVTALVGAPFLIGLARRHRVADL